ncbi:FadR/GntR family transcriptional regulator [Galactobacter valiniphilus]|uniref:FadR/GntR family transcriptional regulator n=1 Tax=Galactobacter valiniphilus TaxID=2676122 RepID=UPI001F1ABA46|nr:FadR/GntR family transcriptional regulator [Galactobacter valiniphilus]
MNAVPPAQFSPAVPVRTYERIVEQIEGAIRAGDLRPGDHLPSERELMTQFSVSRPTVREALRVLQVMGLVESRAGSRGGPEVLAPSSSLMARSLSTLTLLDSVGLTELLQFRMMLESTAVRLAAARRDEPQLELMRRAIDAMEGAVGGDASDFAQADLDFHRAVWKASGNELIAACGQAVSEALLASMQAELSSTADTAALEQDSVGRDRALFEAIEAGRPAEASRLARRALFDRFDHLLSTPGSLEPLVRDEP